MASTPYSFFFIYLVSLFFRHSSPPSHYSVKQAQAFELYVVGSFTPKRGHYLSAVTWTKFNGGGWLLIGFG